MGDNMNLEEIKVEKELKIVYMGTSSFSATVLEGLLTKYNVRAIVTQPDRKVGREGIIKFSPVKECANKHTILVVQPENIKTEYEEILAFQPDLIITCAYGQIIPKELLQAPRLGCINVHASLLPRLRGGAPIQHAIMQGHSKTGITIMYMDEKMDSGDIICQKEIPIEVDDTASSLHDKLAILGRDLLLETLPSIIAGTNGRTKQDEAMVTYAPIIKREDERIDFSKNEKQIYNKVRALYDWPGAYAVFGGKILKIWKCREGDNNYFGMVNGTITEIYEDGFGVKVENGEIIITELQLEGKKRMSGKDFVNGHQNLKGKILE